jgi:hypothetical protein
MRQELYRALELCSNVKQLYAAFGYRGQTMPPEDQGTILIDGVEFVLLTSHGYGTHTTGIFRLHFRCPECNRLVSVGRARQHVVVHADAEYYLKKYGIDTIREKLDRIAEWQVTMDAKLERGEYVANSELLQAMRAYRRWRRIANLVGAI